MTKKLNYINKNDRCIECNIGHIFLEPNMFNFVIYTCCYCGARFEEVNKTNKKTNEEE